VLPWQPYSGSRDWGSYRVLPWQPYPGGRGSGGEAIAARTPASPVPPGTPLKHRHHLMKDSNHNSKR